MVFHPYDPDVLNVHPFFIVVFELDLQSLLFIKFFIAWFTEEAKIPIVLEYNISYYILFISYNIAYTL